MRSPVSRLTLALAGTLLCCSSGGGLTQPPPQCTPIGGPGVPVPPPETILHVGTEERVPMLVAKTEHCDGGDPVASGVRTEVLGPDNLPVAHANSGAESLETLYGTTVTFTPTVAGPYHFTATFDPNLGVVQQDLRVALDRRMPRQVARLSAVDVSGCLDFHLTPHDTVLCQRVTDVVVFRDGAQTQTLSADRMVALGDEVWISRGTVIDRYVDEGTDPLRPGSPSQLIVPAAPVLMTPGPGEVTLLVHDGAQRFAVENGTFVARETWSFDGGAFSFPQLAARSAAGLVLVTPTSLCRSGPDGGNPDCVARTFARLVAMGADGVWVSSDGLTLERYAPGGTQPASVELPRFYALRSASVFWGNRPSAALNESVFALTSAGEPTLEDWTQQFGFTVREVDDGWAVLTSNIDGSLSFVRAP